MFDLDKVVRKNIKTLKPYSCARDEYKGKEAIFMDSNENPYDTGFNRYPDPLQSELKEKIAQLKNVHPNQIFLGNGSDEAIDLMFRAFCEPRIDNAITIHPSYGMYPVCADINDVEMRKVLLNEDFSLNTKSIFSSVDKNTKLIFICSPNNPTANYFPDEVVLDVVNNFDGIVIVDEAYIDFSDKAGLLNCLNQYPNLVIFQTFSKAWGMAGIRLGIAFAHPAIVNILNKIKYPYNVNVNTQTIALEALKDLSQKDMWVKMILAQKKFLIEELLKIPFVKKIFPSDANFFLAQVDEPKAIYEFLVEKKIILRDRSNLELLENCLRITVGTEEENIELLNALKIFKS